MTNCIVCVLGIVIVASQYICLQKIFVRDRGTVHRTVGILLSIHLSIALSTQLFGFFSYPSILVAHTTVVLGLLYYLKIHKKSEAQHEEKKHPLEWGALVLFIATILSLSAVYTNYSGVYNISTSNEYFETEHLAYPYPSVSDEWYAISWVKKTIQTGRIPFDNPLDKNETSFFNLQFPFHSLLAGLFVLFGANPLNDFYIFSVLINCMLVLLLYASIRYFKVSQEIALITSTASLSIPWGATVLGLWSLIPATFGFILIFIFIIESSEYVRTQSSLFGVLLSILLVGLLYPPFLVFVLPICAIVFPTIPCIALTKKYLVLGSLLALGVGAVVMYTSTGVFGYIVQRIFYHSLLGNAQPVLLPHLLLSIVFIIFAFVAVVLYWKLHRMVVTVWCVGVFLWLVYATTTWRFIIGYERVVVVTLFVTLMLSAIGLNQVYELLKEKKWTHIGICIQIVAVMYALVTTIGYTRDDSWKELVAIDAQAQRMYLPGAPIILAFNPDDAELLNQVQGKRILSTPWKGTILGVVSNNVPVITQSGTLTLHPGMYEQFMTMNCEERYIHAVSLMIEYTYTQPFNCPEFIDIGSSREGLQFKKLNKKKPEKITS